METPALLGPLNRINQRFRLALCKKPNKVGASLSLYVEGNRSSFRNVLFPSCSVGRWEKSLNAVILSARRLYLRGMELKCNLKS
jgi:hypothetical protein